jgi:hypothetical protein
MSFFLARRGATLALLVVLVPTGGAAQLRPLDPLDWNVLGDQRASFVLGGAVYSGQRAALAGTKGRLMELGAFKATWTLGRVALEVSGTAVRLFEDHTVYAEPADFAAPPDGSRRTDAGVALVSTVVRLTPGDRDRALALRFGVTLPTTDNEVGLDRDQTDFYSLLVGRVGGRNWSLSGELGLGIFGTRDPANEQVDPLLFGLMATRDLGPATLILELAGHHDPRAGPEFRGNEDLGEGRLGLRFGRLRWLSVSAVRGWTPTSPDFGLVVQVGRRF